MLDVKITGAREVSERLAKAGRQIPEVTEKKMRNLVKILDLYIKRHKIPGGRNKTLRRSLKTTVERSGNEFIGRIGTRLKAGVLREVGGKISAYIIRPVRKKALSFEVKGQSVICKLVYQEVKRIKPDPYLAPALQENRQRIAHIMGEITVEVSGLGK